MPAIGSLRYLEAAPPSPPRAGRTLVLLHAFPLNARMWEPQLELAESGWRVIAPHLRGADGGSALSPASSMDDHAADVVDLLDALRVEDAVIGGLSMGGYVALALFRRAPRYFRGLILADTRPQADSPDVIEGRKRLLELTRQKGAAAVAEELLPKLLGATTRREQPDMVARVRALVESNSPEVIGAFISSLMTRADSTDLLASIHCPTLILVGEEDVLTPPELSQDMQRAISGSVLNVIPGAGHLSSLERPMRFNEVVAQFLEHRV